MQNIRSQGSFTKITIDNFAYIRRGAVLVKNNPEEQFADMSAFPLTAFTKSYNVTELEPYDGILEMVDSTAQEQAVPAAPISMALYDLIAEQDWWLFHPTA